MVCCIEEGSEGGFHSNGFEANEATKWWRKEPLNDVKMKKAVAEGKRAKAISNLMCQCLSPSRAAARY